MRSKKIRLFICLAALGIAAAGCGKEETSTETETAVASETTAGTTDAAEETAAEGAAAEETAAEGAAAEETVTEETAAEEEVIEETEFTARLDTEEDATLYIVGNMDNFESLEAVISDFEEYYPNCEVLYSCLEGSYDSTLEKRLLSDSSVGIFMNRQYTYDSSENVASHCANLLEEEIDFGAIRQETLDSCTVDGKLFELPLAYNTSGLIVNTTLLEKEGLSVPGNYEEFLETCAALKEKGYTPIQGEEMTMFSAVIKNMVFVLLSNEYQTTEDLQSLSSGEEGCAQVLLSAFEKLEELYENGYIDQAVNATYEDNYNDAILKFFEGDVPFLAGTTETFSGTKKRETKSEHFSEEPFEYEFICTPLAEDGGYSYIDNWMGFSVNSECPDKEWAVEFMRFLATSEEINEIASIKGLPSVAKESDDERFASVYENSEENTRMNTNFFPSALDDALWEAEYRLVKGETDAAGAVELMEQFLREGIPEEESETENAAAESDTESEAESAAETETETAVESETESAA